MLLGSSLSPQDSTLFYSPVGSALLFPVSDTRLWSEKI